MSVLDCLSRAPDGDLAARLPTVVARIDPLLCAVESVFRVSAGATLETWSFDAIGTADRVPLVLRRVAGARPDGTLPLALEARVLQVAGRCGVPVPEVFHVLIEDDALGEGFLMRRIEGWTIPQKILRAPELATVRPRLPRQLGEILGHIHAVPLAELPSLPVVDPPLQLQRTQERCRAVETPRPVFEVALRWLEDHLPESCESTLVHGDYRNGNVVVGVDGIRSVLDWEGAHIGDPAQDLAWMCLPPWRFGELDKPVGGLGLLEDLIAGYQSVRPRLIEVDRLKWWKVMGSLRWGILCAEAATWLRTGQDRTIERAVIARRASESELDLLCVLAPR